MKNKNKYDLTKLTADVTYKINGCGKIIPGERIVVLLYEGKKIEKKEIKEDATRYLFDWLESDDGNPG